MSDFKPGCFGEPYTFNADDRRCEFFASSGVLEGYVMGSCHDDDGQVDTRARETRSRLVACVNALSTVERPEKLGELLAAVHRTVNGLRGEGYRIGELQEAFEALGYVAPEEKP